MLLCAGVVFILCMFIGILLSPLCIWCVSIFFNYIKREKKLTMVQNARPVLTYLTSVQISNSEKEHSLHNSEDKFLFGMKLLKQQEKK